MKRRFFLSIALVFFSVQFLFAQQGGVMFVKSFKRLTSSQASRLDSMRNDNVQKCALVKIVTTERDLSFETDAKQGMCGDVDYTHPGEVWVWLSPGPQELVIMHEEFGTLHYPIEDNIESGNVYEMELEARREIVKNYLVLFVSPPEAKLSIDGEVRKLSNGSLSMLLPIGEHSYELRCNLYRPTEGKFRIYADSNTKLSLQLEPNYGFLSVVSIPTGADVYVDDKRVGITPYTSDRMESGSYTVCVGREMYKEGKKTVEVKANQTTIDTVFLAPNFAEPMFVCTDPEAEIWVNGERKGIGRWRGRLSAGHQYKVETRRESHRPGQILTPTLEPGDTSRTEVPAPIPITGKINVNVTPVDVEADILLDGQKVGTTPKVLGFVLIGRHELRIVKSGYAPVICHVEVKEGESEEVNVKLDRQKGTEQVFTVQKGVDIRMVEVKGGTFTMGCTTQPDSDCYDWELPADSVTVDDFLMGETEVTQALWKAVMGDSSNFKGDQFPAESVSWYDCQIFIRKLNELTGWTFRLPTEAEWEYAARGGSSYDAHLYSGSNDINEVAWYGYNSEGGTHEVRTKLPNKLGLYDMSGNVWEWCNDRYAPYSSQEQPRPAGATEIPVQVIRGGAWNLAPRYNRVYFRQGVPVAEKKERTDKSLQVGFRLVKDLQ